MSLLRRNPRVPLKRDPQNPPPDERIFGRHYRGLSPVAIGAIVAILFVVGFYLGFTKRIPFTSRGYELHATFENATTLKPNSPVRIAGVNVGKVSSVEAKGNMAEATFNVEEDALPIHEDATIKIRPRLFLEGNFFLDLHPGSPSAPKVDSGSTIPTTQTTTAVQIDEILTALQSDTRANLKQALEGYGTALNAAPTSAEDATQDPDVQGLTGAQAINETFRYGGKAGRTSAIVNQAILGQHPHDLSGLIRAQRDLFTKLASTDGALSDLITNFNVTAGAFASESANLSASISELAPTLQAAEPSLRHLNEALPWARRLARESLPGIQELPATIRVGSPWLVQAGRLLREPELGGSARLLAASAPGLARAGHASLDLFPRGRVVQPLCVREPGPGRQRPDRQRGRLPVRHRPAEHPGALLRRRPARRREPGLRRQRVLRSFPGRRRSSARGDAQPLGRGARRPDHPEHHPVRAEHRRAHRHPPPAPGVDPARGGHPAAVPDGRSLPHPGAARDQ